MYASTWTSLCFTFTMFCLGALWGEHSLKVACSARAVQRFPLCMHLDISMFYIHHFAVYNPDSIWSARNACDAHFLAVFWVPMLLHSVSVRVQLGGESCVIAPNGAHCERTVHPFPLCRETRALGSHCNGILCYLPKPVCCRDSFREQVILLDNGWQKSCNVLVGP